MWVCVSVHVSDKFLCVCVCICICEYLRVCVLTKCHLHREGLLCAGVPLSQNNLSSLGASLSAERGAELQSGRIQRQVVSEGRLQVWGKSNNNNLMKCMCFLSYTAQSTLQLDPPEF